MKNIWIMLSCICLLVGCEKLREKSTPPVKKETPPQKSLDTQKKCDPDVETKTPRAVF